MMALRRVSFDIFVALVAGPTLGASSLDQLQSSMTVTAGGAGTAKDLMSDGHFISLMRRAGVRRESEISASSLELPLVPYVIQPDREEQMLAKAEAWARSPKGMLVEANGSKFVSSTETRSQLAQRFAEAHADMFVGENVLSTNLVLGATGACFGLGEDKCAEGKDCKWHGYNTKCFGKECHEFGQKQKCVSNDMCVWEAALVKCKAKVCSDLNTSAWCQSNVMCGFDSTYSKCTTNACSTIDINKTCDTNLHCYVETPLSSPKRCSAKTCNGLAQGSCSKDSGCAWSESECLPCFEMKKQAGCSGTTHCKWNTTHSKCHNDCSVFATSGACVSTFHQACNWHDTQAKCVETCMNKLNNDKCNDYNMEQCYEGSLSTYLQANCPLLCRSCPTPCHIYNSANCAAKPACKYHTSLTECRMDCKEVVKKDDCNSYTYCSWNATAATKCGDKASSLSSSSLTVSNHSAQALHDRGPGKASGAHEKKHDTGSIASKRKPAKSNIKENKASKKPTTKKPTTKKPAAKKPTPKKSWTHAVEETRHVHTKRSHAKHHKALHGHHPS